MALPWQREAVDAETGEKLELYSWTSSARPNSSETTASAAESSAVCPAPTRGVNAVLKRRKPPESTSDGVEVHAETQSQRPLGGGVAWQQQQASKVENAELRFRASLAGVRRELQRSELSAATRRRLEAELLEKTKHRYARQVQTLVVQEVERELAREVAVRVELAARGRERLQRRHDSERAFYRQQIERVHDECELALTAAAAQRNLLR